MTGSYEADHTLDKKTFGLFGGPPRVRELDAQVPGFNGAFTTLAERCENSEQVPASRPPPPLVLRCHSCSNSRC